MPMESEKNTGLCPGVNFGNTAAIQIDKNHAKINKNWFFKLIDAKIDCKNQYHFVYYRPTSSGEISGLK